MAFLLDLVFFFEVMHPYKIKYPMFFIRLYGEHVETTCGLCFDFLAVVMLRELAVCAFKGFFLKVVVGYWENDCYNPSYFQ